MRVIIVGAGPLGRHLSEKLIAGSYEVILIDRNKPRATELAELLDCTVINAEGTRPDILEKAGIENADAIVACTDHDQDNIIIGLIARSYNIPEVIIKTDDSQFHTIAKKLGFRHIINPPESASMIVSDALRGIDTIELSGFIRGDVRFMSAIARSGIAGEHFSDLNLPKNSAVIGLYRGNEFILSSENPEIGEGDEIIIVTREKNIREIEDFITAEKNVDS